MNYIFFDVDGVLNGTDKNGKWIDNEIHISKVSRLLQLAKDTNAKLIMSSTWRTSWNNKGELIENHKYCIALNELLQGQLYSVTPVINYNRNLEIKTWLQENANPEDNFVCFDDEYSYYQNDDFYNNKFIHTAPPHCNGAYGNNDIIGLFNIHIEKAKQILLDKE